MKQHKGLSDIAYSQIKSMILQNQLKPGQLVKESDLQELLDLGRTPVREALLRLSHNELVTIHPRKGIEISKVSPKSIHDIFKLRSLIEPLILELYYQNISRDTLYELRYQFESFSDTTQLSANEALALADLDDRFHLTIISAMNNQYAIQMMNSFIDKLTVIRSAVNISNNCRFMDSNKEHLAIIDSLLSNDVHTACELLRAHLAVSYEEAVKTLMLTD